jgi:hypothetical protein
VHPNGKEKTRFSVLEYLCVCVHVVLFRTLLYIIYLRSNAPVTNGTELNATADIICRECCNKLSKKRKERNGVCKERMKEES